MESESFQSLKKDIRSILISAKHGMIERELIDTYAEFCDARIPFRDFEFPNLHCLLESMPDVCHITYNHGQYVYHAIADESTRHIKDMVNRQKTTTRKSNRFGLRGNGNRNTTSHKFQSTYGQNYFTCSSQFGRQTTRGRFGNNNRGSRRSLYRYVNEAKMFNAQHKNSEYQRRGDFPIFPETSEASMTTSHLHHNCMLNSMRRSSSPHERAALENQVHSQASLSNRHVRDGDHTAFDNGHMKWASGLKDNSSICNIKDEEISTECPRFRPRSGYSASTMRRGSMASKMYTEIFCIPSNQRRVVNSDVPDNSIKTANASTRMSVDVSSLQAACSANPMQFGTSILQIGRAMSTGDDMYESDGSVTSTEYDMYERDGSVMSTGDDIYGSDNDRIMTCTPFLQPAITIRQDNSYGLDSICGQLSVINACPTPPPGLFCNPVFSPMTKEAVTSVDKEIVIDRVLRILEMNSNCISITSIRKLYADRHGTDLCSDGNFDDTTAELMQFLSQHLYKYTLCILDNGEIVVMKDEVVTEVSSELEQTKHTTDELTSHPVIVTSTATCDASYTEKMGTYKLCSPELTPKNNDRSAVFRQLRTFI